MATPKYVIKKTKEGTETTVELALPIETINHDKYKKAIETILTIDDGEGKDDEEIIQKVRLEIINLDKHYLVFKKNHNLRRSIIAVSTLVCIIGIVMGQLLGMAKETGSADRLGGLFSGFASASGLIGSIVGFATFNVAQKKKLDSSPDMTKESFKPMYLYISDNILKKIGDFIEPYRYGVKHEPKGNDEYFITYYIKRLKRKNDILRLENYIAIIVMIL
ncbi:hypothetical protein RclHR1_05980008 [Rhizophagus clarus]|uniref:Uncharacterized protein n=1 Tax=Rhizophagus clarus TaxID=94130 RepID=A0A2Z6S6W5_9GLOM|nr:hypothetical protein RclHR1_05980008 [Rhizophagus clarus]